VKGRQSSDIRIALCGDVMLGRGIDQVLPHPGDPKLYERYVPSALDYVALAERANGRSGVPFPSRTSGAPPWQRCGGFVRT
jgi:poly-gamma-glutamate synthesis protein (capsule biosynthesis protein)